MVDAGFHDHPGVDEPRRRGIRTTGVSEPFRHTRRRTDMRARIHRLGAGLLVGAVLALAGCGGGSSGGTTAAPPAASTPAASTPAATSSAVAAAGTTVTATETEF